MITTTGDSLNGMVGWSTEVNTPETVRFRETRGSTVTTYSPSTLRGVHFATGRRLVSRVVQVDQVPTNPEAASEYLQSGRPIKRRDTLFLEVVVEGPLALYTKQGKRDRYYVESNEDIAELIKRTRYRRSGRILATNHRYRRQLANRMSGCAEVREKTEDIRLTYRSLREVVADYNRCKTGTVSFLLDTRPTFTVSYGVVGGVVGSKPKTSGAFSIISEYDLSLGYTLGARAHVKFSKQWAVGMQLAYVGETLRSASALYNDYLIVEINHKAIRLSALPRYYIGGDSFGDWGPYLEGGGSFTYSMVFDEQIVSGGGTGDGYLPSDFRRFAYGATVGGGVEYRAFTLGVRAEVHLGFSSVKSRQFTMVNRSAYAFLGYRF